MRIVFCDDDIRILEELSSYVREYFEKTGGPMPEFAAYQSGDELIENESFVDFAFLDVEMPGLSGIHVGNRLKQINSAVKIFIVTSHPDYLDEAMRFQVFRFLSKPIDKNRLFRNLKDALYQYNMFSKKLLINTRDGAYITESEDIVCIESSGRKTIVYTCDKIIQSSVSLEQWKERLLTIPCFYQSHRSYIINLRYVYKAERDIVLLKYAGKEKSAYLAKRKFGDFKDRFMMFLESTK